MKTLQVLISGMVLVFMLTLISPTPSLAVEPSEILSDSALEARARDISKGLRCLVCQNQSIDDSDADLARDLRVLVRERLTAGDSNEQVLSYVVSRYGDFVLLNPPFKLSTVVLWAGPALFAILGLLAVFKFMRRQANVVNSPVVKAAPLSDEERRQIEKLLKDENT